MDPFEQYFYTPTNSTPRIGTGVARAYGVKAKDAYINAGTPLNSSISVLAKEASLNPDETKRVVEEANKATYLALMSSGTKGNIDFDVASYDTLGTQDVEPDTAPMQKLAAWNPLGGISFLADHDTTKEKTASVRASASSRYFTVAGKLDDVESSAHCTFMAMSESLGKLKEACLVQLGAGAESYEIWSMMKLAGMTKATAEVINDHIGVMGSAISRQHLEAGLQKIASRVPDTDSDVYVYAQRVQQASTELLKLAEWQEGLTELKRAIALEVVAENG